jgi:hypothetical protein
MADNPNAPLSGWVVRSNIRNERLAWIAAKPRLEKLNRRWWHALLALGRTADIDEHGFHGSSFDREEGQKGMQRSALIVDGLAGRFTPSEREVLRLTGRLPEWFWAEYQAEAAQAR